jgi:hypothetical protein
MITKLPNTIKLSAEELEELEKQLYRIFIDNNSKINELINMFNNQYPDNLKFRKNGSNLECSLDGGTTWKIVTLT